MLEAESKNLEAERKKRDRAIWLIYFFMILLILLPLVLFAITQLR